ncbi:helix-turn-helix domain-containing protein [Paenibacillus polymyxa]|uniref:helix-turn-helix domain-containing protein n=1 Tax=Paenibacillus polymyxa TaxID=1406 RepID=UPI002024FDEA|nr:helix-turn-helix domain-containing protein [Paenibacillus polymyxa]MDU8672561.1 helix-turn-helix domain-containing protein [Paenibacillus polymyxa]MDU8697468.1 helix-turn-helix domain-containing protein [Paenibacillus polymyxa]URJ56633.1 helix-turn-helix domain-containing protein [Paenibacillus polymyxa]URJ64063.1 helix-turn-helix domain-containing protein [Paenibacillus polymyxa]URJ71141.1 helix-turn-helix domain-containing protein [Paenibacillus polymyxa]
MSYTHLSIIERSKLEILHQQGKSARAIAIVKELGRHHATIKLRRNAAREPYLTILLITDPAASAPRIEPYIIKPDFIQSQYIETGGYT